jgi:fatty acyl-CoA reductase
MHVSVISTSKEPLVAWNNSVAGPLGIIVGCACGIIRSMYCDGDKVVDLVPVDMVINATIAVAWDVAQNW